VELLVEHAAAFTDARRYRRFFTRAVVSLAAATCFAASRCVLVNSSACAAAAR